MNSSLLAPWLAELIIISYRSVMLENKKVDTLKPIPHLPVPAELASTVIIFGALSFIPGEGQRVATAAGWGLVVATLLNLWNPGGIAKRPLAPTSSPKTQTTKTR